ncbi:SID1 transmembrane family member 1 [Eurytemora carolleeae]|uniref:SID1 transmembrane family member 1 n=1 Tax=Eurytemora carolleeae TaxID=1294199 RepID=UPI000C761B8B|nr:SID1 transmembrane family member 1 [Eurytemora carolleeae]|eukprot:XP_023321572.1 SID1 transmembrane family member 1-like [Eurytemora affinis]
MQYLTVSISTSSIWVTEFKLIVYIQEDFQVDVNETRQFLVSPSAPQFFQFHFPDGMDIGIISMDSPTPLCMTMSVQNISCPVSDLDRNIEFEGIWQTVDMKTGMTIRRDLFPSGLHIVFVVKPDDLDCRHTSLLDTNRCMGPCRDKIVEFTITQKITKEEYLTATFGAFAMFLGAYIIVILVSCLICVRTRVMPQERSIFEVPSRPEPLGAPPDTISQPRSRYGSISSNSTLSSTAASGLSVGRLVPVPLPAENIETLENQNEDEIRVLQTPDQEQRENSPDSQIRNISSPDDEEDERNSPDGVDTRALSPMMEVPRTVEFEGSTIDESDYDLLRDADLDKDVFRTKTFLFVSDLSRKHPKVNSRRSMMYQWNLITIAIFYGLPVVQLVVTYQQVLNQTGNEDLCYYNFLCAHPLGLLSDFNHVYSNIGYVMLGGLFMVFVARRRFIYNQICAENPRIRRMFGIPQHSGLFYAMGLALVMEGLMSGCYHICPNHSNFQFDTAFMYTIAILCMLKIYQFRHPDINANAYTAFGVLAFVILIGVIGVLNSSILFWIFFTGVHVITCLILSIQIYYMGRWKVDAGLFKRIWLMLYNDISSLCMGAWYALKPTYPDRNRYIQYNNFLYIKGGCILVMAQNDKDFASFLLGVFIINLLLYTSFYILMKLRHGERICRQPLTYILLATLSWVPAMYFFLNKSTTWNLSAAQSRHYNQSCRLFHFYDNHDIWHFLSAASLFLSFMVLLTIDDDLNEKPRDKIPVF